MVNIRASNGFCMALTMRPLTDHQAKQGNKMKHILTGVWLIAAVASVTLSGCASVEPTPAVATAAAADEKPVDKLGSNATITGSRIPSKKSEKMVSAIGGADYDRDSRGQAIPLEKK